MQSAEIPAELLTFFPYSVYFSSNITGVVVDIHYPGAHIKPGFLSMHVHESSVHSSSIGVLWFGEATSSM